MLATSRSARSLARPLDSSTMFIRLARQFSHAAIAGVRIETSMDGSFATDAYRSTIADAALYPFVRWRTTN